MSEKIVNPADTPVRIKRGDELLVDAPLKDVDTTLYRWSMGFINGSSPEIVSLFGREMPDGELHVAWESYKDFRKSLDLKSREVLEEGKDLSDLLTKGFDVQVSGISKAECRIAVMSAIVSCYLMTGKRENLARGILVAAEMDDPDLHYGRG